MWLKLLFLVSAVAAQYEPLISSSWSMWSPWSFCSNNVMIRVRACSTVRGYKCIGHNKEFQTCNSPPKRNNLDYEDPEASDREMAMKQLYQDYEPETPDEARYAQTRGNRNFHMIAPTTTPRVYTPSTQPAPTRDFSVLNRGGTGVGMMSDEEEYDETMRMPQSPIPTDPSKPEPSTFGFDSYPKSTEEPTTTTTSTSTTTTTTTTTTTEAPTTTTTEEPTTTPTTPEPIPQTVTPQYPTPRIVDHEAVVEPEDVGFRGKYTLEEPEPLPEVSVPTWAAPPGTISMEPELEQPTPASFPIDVDPEERLTDGSTHSVGSYSIGKEPTWEEEPEPLQEIPSTEAPRSMPTFSIAPSTRRLGEVRRAPTTVNTHIEMPMSMLPFIPTTVQEEPTTTTEEPAPIPANNYAYHPKIALITSQQNVQHFPKMMNEQRASPRSLSRTAAYPTEYTEEAKETTKKQKMVTVEITNKTLKKKRRNRRLKKLNRLGRIRTVAVLPTEFTAPATEPMKPMPTPSKFELQEEKFIVPKAEPAQPASNQYTASSWSSDKNRQVFEENRELEARIAALRNKLEMNQKILAKKTPEVETTVATTSSAPLPEPDQVMLEGDTARALSWMINDMERLVDDNAKTDVVDRLPVEKVEETEGFRLGEPEEDATTTTVSPFPFPIPEDGFALIRSKRSVSDSKLSALKSKRVLWSSWSEWTDCRCGKQSRKRKCLKHLGGPKYPYDDHVFIPIDQTTNGIEFGEPAEFPETIEEPAPIDNEVEESSNRVKRSLKCPPPEIEVRSCQSLVC